MMSSLAPTKTPSHLATRPGHHAIFPVASRARDPLSRPMKGKYAIVIVGVTIGAVLAISMGVVVCKLVLAPAITRGMAGYYYALGTQAHRRGNDKEAMDDYNRAITADPKFANAYYGRGILKLDARDLDGATAEFDRALRLAPKLAVAWYGRGLAKDRKGNHLAAIADYDEALKLAPNTTNAWRGRAVAKWYLKDWDGVIADESKALELDPRLADAYEGRGVAYWNKGNANATIADLDHALDLNPQLTNSWHYRALAKSSKRDWDGALADYNRLLQIKPGYPVALVGCGITKQHKGDLAGAIADETSALEIDPKYGYAWANRALARILAGDREGAATDIRRALEIDPGGPLAYAARASLEYYDRNWTDSLRDFRRYSDLTRTDKGSAQLSIWLLRARLNEKEEADKDLAAYRDGHKEQKAGDFTTKLADFFLARISEADLIAAAEAADPKERGKELCRAWYCAGMKKLLDSDEAAAKADFEKCVATQEKSIWSFHAAEAELQALGK